MIWVKKINCEYGVQTPVLLDFVLAHEEKGFVDVLELRVVGALEVAEGGEPFERAAAHLAQLGQRAQTERVKRAEAGERVVRHTRDFVAVQHQQVQRAQVRLQARGHRGQLVVGQVQLAQLHQPAASLQRELAQRVATEIQHLPIKNYKFLDGTKCAFCNRYFTLEKKGYFDSRWKNWFKTVGECEQK